MSSTKVARTSRTRTRTRTICEEDQHGEDGNLALRRLAVFDHPSSIVEGNRGVFGNQPQGTQLLFLYQRAGLAGRAHEDSAIFETEGDVLRTGGDDQSTEEFEHGSTNCRTGP